MRRARGQRSVARAGARYLTLTHSQPPVRLADGADHIAHIREVAGVDYVGIAVELARRGFTDSELAKVAGGNLLRVMREAEWVSARLAPQPPSPATIARSDAPAGQVVR